MTAQKRLRQKINRHNAGRHTGHYHVALEKEDPDHPGHGLPVNCPVCRPAAKKQDRSLAGKAVS